MPYKSRWAFTPTISSIPDFIFEEPEYQIWSDDDKIYIDATRPETHFWTVHTFRQASQKFSAGLTRNGFASGQRLALFAGNSIFSPVVVMGTLMAGGIYTSINPGFTIREVIYQLKDSSPTFILAAPSCFRMALDAADAVGLGRERVFLFEDVDVRTFATATTTGPGQSWMKLFPSPTESANFAWEKLPTREASRRTALLAYSSGTTGLPKVRVSLHP